jgi:hypothetical protein
MSFLELANTVDHRQQIRVSPSASDPNYTFKRNGRPFANPIPFFGIPFQITTFHLLPSTIKPKTKDRRKVQNRPSPGLPFWLASLEVVY